MSKRPVKRRSSQLRPIRITRRFTETTAGSVLIEMGQTRVLCTASLENSLPHWRKESGLGWVTAEYNMLPGSTSPRKPRPKAGKTDSRATEIQRLIGRVLRSVVDFKKLGPNAIYLDCDVLQADGGTRTAAINGAYLALVDAVKLGIKDKRIAENPITGFVGAVSVGLINHQVILDLDYELDSRADVDLNVAMTDAGDFVELQGTGEQTTFSHEQLNKMLSLAQRGIKKIITLQKKALPRKVTLLRD